MNTSTEHQGIVFRKSTGAYWVNTGVNGFVCGLSNRLRKQLIYPTADRSSIGHHKAQAVVDAPIVDPVAIGDWVRLLDGGNGEGLITEVLPRRSKLTRRAAGRKPIEQVVVANVDQIIAVLPASRPTPDLVLLDRYLLTAEAAGIPAIIVITKWDEEAQRRDYIPQAIADYQSIGYDIITTSATTGEGIETLAMQIKDKLSVLMGVSGAGKTSLLNAVQPQLGLRVAQVSARHGEGRHTTTHLEMFELANGGYIIDTPGMREFGLWDVPKEELIELFVETADYVGLCKFNNCTHHDEPACAIKRAVEAGQMPLSRYRSHLKIRGENA